MVKEGDKVKVKCIGLDDRGKVRLSMRAVNQETGEALEVEERPRPERGRERGDRGDRGDRGRPRREG